MLQLAGIHHVALICSDYQRSKAFYTGILGFEVIAEVFREERNSWKLDLALNGQYLLELFTFPGAPHRPSWPEAQGLRHLAFAVEDIEAAAQALATAGIEAEPVRIDPHTGKRFLFFSDPDNLPLELYQR
ncbi:VOC family protein [Pokkaliibacter sp. CJK22405]|uniref:SMU1112c/YaeR family gloxylase I-like metalloprotein n=1 Tax=Pokkaliibacter sp. CJK22405 TaxID=3384615 RepID=UPI003984A9AE